MDVYDIPLPQSFDLQNKYLLLEYNGIKYIKLRLKDASTWSTILTNIFGQQICTVKDYESINKPIKDLYTQFKTNYRLPSNFLSDIMNCKYLNYYYSPNEIQEYIGQWTVNITHSFTPYTENEYKMYEELTIENAHLDYVQINHYMDEGCLCKACFMKRQQMATQLIHGQSVTDRVVHIEAKNELLTMRVEKVNRINTFNASIRPMPKGGRKDFRNEMTNVVRSKK